MHEQIKKEMRIGEIFERFPSQARDLASEMMAKGLHCIGCGAAGMESLEEGMMAHGFSEEEISKMVAALNAIVARGEEPLCIALTPKAAEKFRAILKEEGKEGHHLRLGGERVGCSGFEYHLDYSEEAQREDQIFVSEGIEIHVREDLVPHMLGVRIDFVEGCCKEGFQIINPRAKRGCCCHH